MIRQAHSDDWRTQLSAVVEMMREMSLQTDPQEMVRAYGRRVREMIPSDGFIALSRRDLDRPHVRVTRWSGWEHEINPWRERDRLPVLDRGLLSELIYGDEPRIIDDIQLAPDDPSAPFLDGIRSLAAVPNYDRGESLNMTLRLSRQPGAFDPTGLPELVWTSNLFGRATQNLVLSAELKQAYDVVDRELRLVADIQRSLLPSQMPSIPNLDLAAHYQTSRWAGGDYYDFFALPDDRWGILIADVSGHGTPAAVMMAITHSIAHTYPGPPNPPDELLTHVNRQLAARYTSDNGTFVTAFYAIFDPKTRCLTYASAGHNPPRLKRCSDGTIAWLDGANGLPLGLFDDTIYESASIRLIPGDQIILYTDGITEANDPAGQMYGSNRLDQVLENCALSADGLIQSVLESLEAFTAGRPADDDRTLMVAKVR